MTKGKKIAIGVVTSIIALLVIAVIVLAVIRTSFYNPLQKEASYVAIWTDGELYELNTCYNPTTQMHDVDEYTEGNKIYNKIVELNNKSREEGLLTSLLGNAYGFEATVTEVETTVSTIKNLGTVLQFVYTSVQTFEFDGKVYKDNDGNTVTYNHMYIEVKDTENLTETTAYLVNNNEDTDSNFKISFLAKQAELFDYLANL